MRLAFNPSTAELDLVGPAASGGARYEHVQAAPSASWIVTHSLGYYPVVAVLIGNAEVITDVDHGSVNQSTLTFAAPVTGRAVFV